MYNPSDFYDRRRAPPNRLPRHQASSRRSRIQRRRRSTAARLHELSVRAPWVHDAPQWGSKMAESAAGLLHGVGEQGCECAGLPRRARQVLDDEFHTRGSRGTLVIIGGLLPTIGALLQDVGNILESLVVERMILEGSPTNTSTPTIYQPLPAAPSAPQHHANDEDEDDHQCLMQRQGRKERYSRCGL